MELNLKVASKEISQLMWSSGKTLSTAESCSAGRIATILTIPAGSSVYFKGGLVCYADEMKEKFLGVSKEIIAEKTAVCEDVARQMVIGANEMFGSDYSIAITGFAGPGGGSEESPIGTIWIAIGSKDHIKTQKVFNDLGRDENTTIATETAISMLIDFLTEELEKK
ncbi:MAG: CinA family protein [Bacteroidaceae bacterium]|jgi:nicotinamide-nucleotide amidase|nr:CinA family protein [Bacteroidaceae bacterium]